MVFTAPNALSYQEIKHKIEKNYLYSNSKEFKKDVVNYLCYVYCLDKEDSVKLFTDAKSKYSEPSAILDVSDEKAEEIYENTRCLKGESSN